ncbi:MAG: ATP-binding protein [Defluviicoccus sp.]|nr:ATP-binding protein [Defluviicoccus sp.]
MNQLSNSLIESLLYESEGNALDFKREQYKFNGASKDEKAELLKDILAFVNSWRRTTAYIIMGVDENKGNRGEVIGISQDLEDANLQQFVNSKTNKPVTFAYRTLSIENKTLGVIEIPVHERPIYLTSAFGKRNYSPGFVVRCLGSACLAPILPGRAGSAAS